jgi:hypothetical protein
MPALITHAMSIDIRKAYAKGLIDRPLGAIWSKMHVLSGVLLRYREDNATTLANITLPIYSGYIENVRVGY